MSKANEALDKKAENARELGLDYEPAQQKPYGWIGNNSGAFIKNTGQKNVTGKPLYTSPPAQRTWVGLSDTETEHLWEISRAAMPRYHTFKTLIEKALRERNT